MEDVGTPHAVGRALSLRQTNNWALKTDIVSFFDRIQRQQLLTRLSKNCPPSLIPLLEQVINCEISATVDEHEELRKQGIVQAEGLRQGMPLSPLLSNYVLRPFDRRAIKAGYTEHMVRYADDLIFLFPSKKECKDAESNVREWLAELKHSIPELNAVKTKTKIVPPHEPVEFLGIEIAYDGTQRRYARRIPVSSITRICDETVRLGSLAACRANSWGFSNFALHMASKLSSYRSTYEDTKNLEDFMTKLNFSIRQSSIKLLKELFGTEAIAGLNAEKLSFLGLVSNDRDIEQ